MELKCTFDCDAKLLANQPLTSYFSRYIVGRTEEKLEKVVEVHGKDIAGQIIPIVGDVSTKDGVQ